MCLCVSHIFPLLSSRVFYLLYLSVFSSFSISILKRVLLRARLGCAEALSVILLQSALIHHTANMWPLQPYIIQAHRERERERENGSCSINFCSPLPAHHFLLLPSSSSVLPLHPDRVSHLGGGKHVFHTYSTVWSLSTFRNESEAYVQRWSGGREGWGGR